MFAALVAVDPDLGSDLLRLVRNLTQVRQQVADNGSVVASVIEELDPVVAKTLDASGAGTPLHVLAVGTFSINAGVGQLGDDIAVFHCIEWFQTFLGERALVAHETAHAYHRLLLRQNGQALPPEDDLAWMLFSEGLATQASRLAAPELAEVDYFWYGFPNMAEWLEWNTEHAGELEALAAAEIENPKAVDMLFGGGTVEGRWRVGFPLADRLVAGLGATVPDLARLPVDQARQAMKEALANK